MELRNGYANENNEEFLVERIKQGDKEAFMRIVSSYQQRVFVLAYSMVREREDALDLVQETFMRIYEKIHTYRPGANFNAWLMQVARNISIDFLRRQKSRRKDSLDSLDAGRVDLQSRETDPSRFNPGDMIQKAVARLPEKQKLVFILHHYEELKYEEIARRLRISVGTVKSLHFKAIQKLRKALAPQLGGGQ
jgi:RNA polymerase sigma-70 factor (ECF subfamily)